MRHSGLSLGPTGISYLEGRDWVGTFSYRWLQSDHHFRGDEDEGPTRYALGNEVNNNTHTFKLNATYGFSPRFSLSLALPLVHNTRSSLYEHDRTNRYETSAGGLADLRLVGYAWLSRPERHTNGNLALGRFSFNVSAPAAVYRNRFQSVTDKEMGRHGDAAFADWFITAGVAHQF